MGLALMAPLFLAGIGLLLAPYIIHQIRRPEREPLKFSSLLFIPNVSQEVIERRRAHGGEPLLAVPELLPPEEARGIR